MTIDRRSLVLSCAAGAILSVAAGVAAICWPIGDPLARLSYDLPFLFSRAIPSEVVLIYIDTKVKSRLREPTDVPLSRRYHAQLVERLAADGAALIFYDILLDAPDSNPENDQALAAAMRKHGRVVLVADYIKTLQGNVLLEAPEPPIVVLREASAGWGLARIKPDPDLAIREIDPGAELHPSGSWVAANFLRNAGPAAPLSDNSRFTTRWLNYYCPPPDLPAIDFDHALDRDGLPAGYFKNKIVIIGQRPSVGAVGAQRDEFASPFSRLAHRPVSGAEVHTFSLLNLWHGDWLNLASRRFQLFVGILFGCSVGAGLSLLRPWTAIFISFFAALVIFAVSVLVQLKQHTWWYWAIPAIVQTPAALLWAVGSRYLLESRKRQRLRNAFSVYLSPYLADRIARSEFDLSLGGKQIEATVMFTDLAGFTAMSEKLQPQEVSTILTTYFTRTTRHILERDGTIIKYLGDGIMAVWGAPLPNPHHQRDAVMAACKIVDESKTDVAGRRLRTRIGINTGPVLAGNLGSEFRFDYTTIGATTNLASRLESLNKVLGTNILITEATRQALPPEIATRCLGRFVLSGTTEPVELHEVLGLSTSQCQSLPSSPSAWCGVFAQALQARARHDFAAAAAHFQRVMALRDGHDGPSQFYLSQDKPSAEPIRIESK